MLFIFCFIAVVKACSGYFTSGAAIARLLERRFDQSESSYRKNTIFYFVHHHRYCDNKNPVANRHGRAQRLFCYRQNVLCLLYTYDLFFAIFCSLSIVCISSFSSNRQWLGMANTYFTLVCCWSAGCTVVFT